MAETKPIPVRLSDDITDRLDTAAKRIGTNRAGVIRLLISTWLSHFEKFGRAALPPDWQELMAANDNRTWESKMHLELQDANSATDPAEELGKALIEGKISEAVKPPGAVPSPSGKTPRKAKAVVYRKARRSEP